LSTNTRTPSHDVAPGRPSRGWVVLHDTGPPRRCGECPSVVSDLRVPCLVAPGQPKRSHRGSHHGYTRGTPATHL
jgi:hypothetical protein